jgi:hypothetical protein
MGRFIVGPPRHLGQKTADEHAERRHEPLAAREREGVPETVRAG